MLHERNTILFSHHSVITAKVIYDFSQIRDFIMVLPETSDAEIPGQIEFYKENNSWTTSSAIRRFPKTYQSLSKSVEGFFDNTVLSDHAFQLHALCS